MLRRTFLHLPGVGEATERRWWARGWLDWQDALQGDCSPAQAAALARSIEAFEQGQWRWFERMLGAAHKWRAWGELKHRAVFVDVETDGGYGPESITIVGAFDGREVRAFVADENLQEAADYLENFSLLVTYNGARFDLPLLRSRFTHRLQNFIHLDLRYPLHRLGLRGGLKKIEALFGLERSAETKGLNGWDAVRLWREWREGSEDARRVLLSYNAEDVRHLQPLAEWVYARGCEEVFRL